MALPFLAIASASFAGVSFTFNASDPAFAGLAIYDDYTGVSPVDTASSSFTSNGILYSALINDVGVYKGTTLAAVIGSTEIPNRIVSADGDEDILIQPIDPSLHLHRVGMETYTINAAGNPLSVPNAPDVVVTVTTTAGTFVQNVTPDPSNHGFLGISSTDEILSVQWFGELGRVKDTGFTNLRVSNQAVPEPTSLAALAVGVTAVLRRRKSK